MSHKCFQTLYKYAIMRFYELLSEDQSVSDEVLDRIDVSSWDAFNNSLRRLTREQVQELQKIMTKTRDGQVPENALKLFHGAPRVAAEDIKKNGFKLTKGRRSGFMGAINHVENQGIFLTDAKGLAGYFGSNRSEYGHDYEVLTCYVEPSGIADISSIPRPIIRWGLEALQRWDGVKRTRIPMREWWWLLDKPEFVNQIKAEGFTGIRFREDKTVLKAANREFNSAEGHTYMIFDPSMIRVEGKDIIRTVHDFFLWLQDNRS